MEENKIIVEQKVTINSSELLKKFKTREDRYNFMRENSKIIFFILDLYLPKETGYDSYFFLQVLSGSKKVKYFLLIFQLIPLGHHSDFNLRYYRKDKVLTKAFLIKIIQDKEEYKDYFPDNIKFENITRDFLLSVSKFLILQIIAYVTPNIYAKLYELYKSKEMEKETSKWNNYEIKIQSALKDKINQYVPCQR